jgi:hypothetical protein
MRAVRLSRTQTMKIFQRSATRCWNTEAVLEDHERIYEDEFSRPIEKRAWARSEWLEQHPDVKEELMSRHLTPFGEP